MLDSDEFPNRPDNPDFWRLSELVLQLDGQASEGGNRIDEIVATVVDPRSLAYVAMHRAMRVLGISTRRELTIHMAEAARLATVYHEGFVIGCRFEAKKRNKK